MNFIDECIQKTIKRFITEVRIDQHKQEIENYVLNSTYVSFGENEQYDPDKFENPMPEIKTQSDEWKKKYWPMSVNKPYGGIWASPVNSENGWLDFAGSAFKKRYSDPHHFVFKLAPNANIYIIDTLEDLKRICKEYNLYLGFDSSKSMSSRILLQNGYDGVFVTEHAAATLRYIDDPTINNLDSWDVESICVLNKDVIVPLKENEYSKEVLNGRMKKNTWGDEDEYGYYFNDVDSSDYFEHPDYIENYRNHLYQADKEKVKNNKVNQKLRGDHFAKEYFNQNIHPDNRKLFNGIHPAIAAQGDENDYDTDLARRYDGTFAYNKKGRR